MRFWYRTLGEQPAGSIATVSLTGSQANVMLLDGSNFESYKRRLPFSYTGGFARHSPVRLRIPHDGRWYVVADLGGYHGRVRIKDVEVSPPTDAVEETDDQKVVFTRQAP
jgi:hypothetical protein